MQLSIFNNCNHLGWLAVLFYNQRLAIIQLNNQQFYNFYIYIYIYIYIWAFKLFKCFGPLISLLFKFILRI
jgi:hypothetical protein